MFNFRPNTAVPGFRVGLPDDDQPGFNVADDGSTPPVLPGAPVVPTIDGVTRSWQSLPRGPVSGRVKTVLTMTYC
jgi:hypothetical protein